MVDLLITSRFLHVVLSLAVSKGRLERASQIERPPNKQQKHALGHEVMKDVVLYKITVGLVVRVLISIFLVLN